ncbi:MAG: mechanosensitive ion channel family protein [Bradymonadaceae bacterium]|nr:mechanosensitive ion channel family protein [Lujinxingiaceae bacterium]
MNTSTRWAAKLLCGLWVGLASARAWAQGEEGAAAAVATAEGSASNEGPLPGYEQFIDEVLTLNFFEIPLWRIGAACAILLLGIFLRTHLLNKLLTPVHLIVSKTKTDADDQLLAAVRKPLGWLVNMIALYFAVLLLELPAGIQGATVLILKTVGTVFAAWMVFNIVDAMASILQVMAEKTETELDDHLVPLVKRVLRVVLVVITLIMIIQQWGYDVTSLVAGLGIGGLAFALAAQSTLSNWFGSVMILTDRPFKVGDLVKSTHGEGTVEEIGLRSTKIRTFARTIITVPNADIATAPVENLSKIPVRHIKSTIGLVYSTSEAQMTEVITNIRQMLSEHEGIDQSFFMVNFTGFGDSSLDILIHAFATTTEWKQWFDTRQDVYLKVMGIVEAAGTSFAFPSQSLYFETPLDRGPMP